MMDQANLNHELLVTILKEPNDYVTLLTKKWYRIPKDSVSKMLKDRWPPQWLAFYQTAVFGPDKYTIQYYAKVKNIREVERRQLFPQEKLNSKSEKVYYKLEFETLQKRLKPIISQRFRRVVFIPTTFEKFDSATEINDLYDRSPLEEKLWKEFKKRKIIAERQEYVKCKNNLYALDFAVFCHEGHLDIETDGDTFHTKLKDVERDNIRDNALETNGWRILRFNSAQINEQMFDYCLPLIEENISKLGGTSV